jgi:hypothetical protein
MNLKRQRQEKTFIDPHEVVSNSRTNLPRKPIPNWGGDGSPIPDPQIWGCGDNQGEYLARSVRLSAPSNDVTTCVPLVSLLPMP